MHSAENKRTNSGHEYIQVDEIAVIKDNMSTNNRQDAIKRTIEAE